MIEPDIYNKLPEDLQFIARSVIEQKNWIAVKKNDLRQAEECLARLKAQCSHTVSAFRQGWCPICESILDIRP
jgi:putative protein kinase ArgK-like GTPase of G3E family